LLRLITSHDPASHLKPPFPTQKGSFQISYPDRSQSLTGGKSNTLIHVHRYVLIIDYYLFHLHVDEFQSTIWISIRFQGFAPIHIIATLCFATLVTHR